MKTTVLYLFAIIVSLLFTSCKRDNPKPNKTTHIKGKVVTFREDALHYDGPIDVTLRFAWGTFPQERIETKTIYPPYEYEFVLDTTHRVYDELAVDVETDVPNHAHYYAGDGQNVKIGTSQTIKTNLMPRTAIRYELINVDGNADEYIAISRIGGGSLFSHTTSTDYILDEGYYNGKYPVRYGVVDKTTGEFTSYTDTIILSPFDTTNHTIRF